MPTTDSEFQTRTRWNRSRGRLTASDHRNRKLFIFAAVFIFFLVQFSDNELGKSAGIQSMEQMRATEPNPSQKTVALFR
jgi:hypothetical protein